MASFISPISHSRESQESTTRLYSPLLSLILLVLMWRTTWKNQAHPLLIFILAFTLESAWRVRHSSQMASVWSALLEPTFLRLLSLLKNVKPVLMMLSATEGVQSDQGVASGDLVPTLSTSFHVWELKAVWRQSQAQITTLKENVLLGTSECFVVLARQALLGLKITLAQAVLLKQRIWQFSSSWLSRSLSWLLFSSSRHSLTQLRCTLKYQTRERSVFTVYFKILTSHFQLLMLVSSFDLDWPNQVSYSNGLRWKHSWIVPRAWLTLLRSSSRLTALFRLQLAALSSATTSTSSLTSRFPYLLPSSFLSSGISRSEWTPVEGSEESLLLCWFASSSSILLSLALSSSHSSKFTSLLLAAQI